MSEANAEQRSYWGEKAGPVWVENQERLDAQIAPHGERALRALAVAPGEQVLDVGCGCGASTLKLAEAVGSGGRVVGIDISSPMLERAAQRVKQAGLTQVETRLADAQTAELGSGFDVVHSRFGVMFFEDPERAFANLHSALRPGGRLGFVCWQPPMANPWVTVPMAAAAAHLEMPPPPPPDSPGMFGLADRERLARILPGAGFENVTIASEKIPLRMGDGSPEASVALFLEVGPVAGLLREQGASDALRARVRESVLEAMLGVASDGVVELGSSVWLVTATA